MEKLTHSALLILSLIFAVACQKISNDDIGNGNKDVNKSNVTFKINQIEQIPFAQAKYASRSTDITELCSHIFLAVYNGNGRVVYKSQNSSDKNFGEISVPLSAGTYHVVILAYNSKDNPSSSTDPEKINFGNNGKMSDTFWWSDEIDVKSNLEKDVTMKRAVAMFRLITTDNIPANVAKMKFHYTGGSSTINGFTGIGNANSKQDETISVTSTGKPGTFEVYTFPKDDENILTMEVTALDSNGNTITNKTFKNVPITRNKITQYKGEFFTGGEGESSTITFQLTTDDEWSIIEETY